MRRAGGLAAFAALVLASAVALGDGEPPAKDGGGLDCGEVMDCSDECGLKCSGISKIGCLIDCRDSCGKKGCATARKAFEALSGCMKSNCPFKCAGGPSEKCRKCGKEDCAETRAACTSHRCVESPKPQPPPDAGGVAPGG